MFLSRTMKAAAVAASFYSFSAHAGQNLHFKTQTVDTNEVSVLSQFRSASPTNYQVVQFKNVISAEDRKALEDAGVQIIRYIPDDAYLVKAAPESLAQLSIHRSVQTVIPYIADFKVSPAFGVIDHLNGNLSVKVSVATFSEAATQELTDKIAALGELQYAKGKGIGVVTTLSAVKQISEMDGVEWVEPYPEFKTQNFDLGRDFVAGIAREKTINDLDGFESGTRIMNFEAAWGRGFTGRGQLVAFSDTGLDSGNMASIHQDFQGQVKKGYAYGLLSFSWNDPMGHGTHVAGSVAGNGNASGGVVRGGAYGAQLIAGGMWSQLLNNMIPPQDITKMFADAYKDGARVHTNSWGSPQNLGAYDQFAQTVDEYMWNNPDMLLMFAAGNSGTDQNEDGRVDEDSIGTPATAKNVLSVGASENREFSGGIQRRIGDLKNQDGEPLFKAEPIISDFLSNNENGIAAFSSRGPTDDRRMKPDVVAPGSNILSVRSQEKDASVLWGALNQDYVWSGGTSMSTPLVAGGVAVLREYLASRGINNPSAALIKGLMMHTATDLYPGQFGQGGKATGQELLTTRPNPHQGFGRVNMDAATSFLENTTIMTGALNAGGKGTAVVASSGQPQDYKITMIYTDAPAAASASKALVNNLDIRVLEDGQLIAEGRDAINNFEYIELAGVTGELRVEVIPTNLPTARPDGSLPFELIISPL